MKKTISVGITVLIALIVGSGFGYYLNSVQNSDKNISESTEKVDHAEDKANNESDKESTEDSTDTDDESGDEQIIVTSPEKNATVSKSSFKVTGRAIAFENVVTVRVTDGNGFQLLEKSVSTKAPDTGEFGDFSITLNVITNSDSGTIEVFEYSAKDGSEINKVSVPINFSD